MSEKKEVVRWKEEELLPEEVSGDNAKHCASEKDEAGGSVNMTRYPTSHASGSLVIDELDHCFPLDQAE